MDGVHPGTRFTKLLTAAKAHWFAGALALAFVVATFQNVTLGRINAGLRAQQIETISTPAEIGDYVGPVRGVGLDGRHGVFDPKGRGMLFMTISPFCGVCQRNLPAARELAEKAQTQGFQVVWVSRDTPTETQKYFDWLAATPNANALVLTDPPHATYQALRLGLVPQTLVVDAGGFVQHSVLGALNRENQAALIQALGKAAMAQSLGVEPRASK